MSRLTKHVGRVATCPEAAQACSRGRQPTDASLLQHASKPQRGEGRRVDLRCLRPFRPSLPRMDRHPEVGTSGYMPALLRSCTLAVVLATILIHVPLAQSFAQDTPEKQPQPTATKPSESNPSATLAADAHNWPLFRATPLSTGVAVSSLPEELELLWQFEVKDGAFEGTPAIVGGVAYIGDLDGTVYALGLADGKKHWEFKTDSGFAASPAVYQNRVYIGDIDGRFYCLEADTGKAVWGYETGAEINSSANFYKGNVLVGSQDANLYCLDAATGKEVWKFAIDDQIRCTPTIVGDRVFLAGCDSKLHIVDLTIGKAIDQVPIDSPTGVTPAVLGDVVYFGTEGGTFYAIDWKAAKVKWTVESEQGTQSIRSSAAVTPEAIYYGGHDRRIRALKPDTGAEIWTFLAKRRVSGSPVVVGNRVIIGADDGRLYAFDRATGNVVWEYETRGGFTGSAAVADEKMVIANDKGVVFCFGKKTE